jgi:hypothetical protein
LLGGTLQKIASEYYSMASSNLFYLKKSLPWVLNSSAFLSSSSGYSFSFGGSGPKEAPAAAGVAGVAGVSDAGFSSTEALPKTSSRILTPSLDEVSLIAASSLVLASSLLSLLAVVSLSFF